MKVSSASEGDASLRSYAEWDDASLVWAVKQDDQKAFAEVYQRYWLKMYQVACLKVSPPEVAEEMVQDLFAALWSRRDTNNIQKLEPYLYSALRYQIVDFIRTKLVRADYLAYCQLHALPIDDSTEQSLAANDLSAALASSLGKLPAQAREVFRLSRLEHQTVPEIAVRMNVSPKMVEYHLTKALKTLRVALKEFLISVMLVLLFT